MSAVIEQCESPIETPGQSGKHVFAPRVGNKVEGKIMETEEGASSCSLAFLKEWVGEFVGPTKGSKLPQGLAKPRRSQTYCKPKVGTVRRDMNGRMPEEKKIKESMEQGSFL